MIDLKDIQARYAAMTNGELEHLLQHADGLRRDAFIVLKQECRKRNIFFSDLLKETDENLIGLKKNRIRENISKEEKKWWGYVLSYSFEQKYNDASDDTILAGLLGMRATLEEALYIENNLGKLAQTELANAMTDTMAGITKTVCGIAIIIIVHLAMLRDSIMIYGGIIMALGLVQMANAASRKSRYRTIINNIQAQAQATFDQDDHY